MHYQMAPYSLQHVVVKCRVVVFIIVLVNPGVSADMVMRVKGFYSLNTVKFGFPLIAVQSFSFKFGSKNSN